MPMMTPLVLILLGALCRILPHPPNAVAIGAFALFAGAKISGRWAWTVPVGAMLLADLWLDWGTGRSVFEPTRLTIYATYAAITLLGRLARSFRGWTAPIGLGALSLSGSAVFFLTTNFACWLDPILGYPRTVAGLVACYASALAFARDHYTIITILTDLFATWVLFGLDALLRRVHEQPRRAVAAELSATSGPALAAVDA